MIGRVALALFLTVVLVASSAESQSRLLPVPPAAAPIVASPRGRLVISVGPANPYAGPVFVPDGYFVPYVEPRLSVRVITPRVEARTPPIDVSGIDLDVQRPPWAKDGERPRHDQPPPVRPKPPEPKRVPPVAEPPPPKPPEPQPAKVTPMDEAARLTTLGLVAFRTQDYGLAARRFQQARELDPVGSRALFLLGQAYFALGKYRDAVQMIGLGLGLDPTWPKNAFRPRFDLYGDHPEDWQLHMEFLLDARNRRPNDAGYLFLLAHQRWFDDQRAEATDLFRQVRPLVADPALVDLFLKPAP